MLYKGFAVLIVAFWLLMTGLLVRNHVGSGSKALREVPLAYVVKSLFQNEHSSDLQILQDKNRLGMLHISPHTLKDPPRRVIDFSGNIFVVVPGVPRQRLRWDGSLELTPSLEVQRFVIGLDFRIPENYRTELVVDVAAGRAHFVAMLDRHIIEQQEYTLDADGARAALERMEIDPALLQAIQNSRPTSSPVVRAQQSSWQIHGEKVDTFLVTVEQSEQTLLEVQIDMLGQIANVKTLLGYTLAPDSVSF